MFVMEWTNIFTPEELYQMRVDAVTELMECDTSAKVEAGIEYAKILNFKKFDSWNYPIFLEMFKEANSATIIALREGYDAYKLFEEVQPNYFIIDLNFPSFVIK